MAGQMVSFASDGDGCDGYLATASSGKGPGVVVIQEWWGLVPHIMDICDRFAGEGFTALAPDLYHGKMANTPDEAGKLMSALDNARAGRDLAGAFDCLKGHDACTGKIGTVGYCMGGGFSLYLATLRPVDACVIYYGVVPGGVDLKLSNLAGPVLGHYAQEDAWANEAAARDLEAKIKAAGQPGEIHIYPGTNHAFFNETRPEVYRAGAARLSWERTLAFYRQHLG